MVRKQIYIEPRQEALLKELAHALGVTEAELIRQAIDRQLGGGRAGSTWLRPDAWAEERAWRESWVRGAAAKARKRRWMREELYEERLGRYARSRDR